MPFFRSPAGTSTYFTRLPIATEIRSATSCSETASPPLTTYVFPSCPRPVSTAAATAATSRASTIATLPPPIAP